MPTAKVRATTILGEFEQARTELISKAVVLTDGKAGTVESVWLDEMHGLRISIRGHHGKWPVSTIKFAQGRDGRIRHARRRRSQPRGSGTGALFRTLQCSTHQRRTARLVCPRGEGPSRSGFTHGGIGAIMGHARTPPENYLCRCVLLAFAVS